MAHVKRRKAQEPLRTQSGAVLTDEMIEGLAAEAEAGYDLTRARPERVGRPSLDQGISPRVTFRASRKLYEAALARAEHEQRTMSELAREALERYVLG